MTDCVISSRCRDRYGYPRVRWAGKEWREHRITLEEKLCRPLAPGECALHACHNPACINPDHLKVGTPADNSADMVQAGRSLYGERHPQHKLTEANVRAIHDLHRFGWSQRQIARCFPRVADHGAADHPRQTMAPRLRRNRARICGVGVAQGATK